MAVEKLHLYINTAGQMQEAASRIVDELRKSRRGNELFVWEESMDDAIAGEEEEG